MPTKCLIHNCSKPSVSKGLCDTHRKRRDRNGHTENTRPEDWGKREAHPAYGSWTGLRRHHESAIPDSWKNDFWAFVADVPEKPIGRCQAMRPNPEAPWSKNNFYWKEPIAPAELRADKAAYMREWQRRVRSYNPEYGKDAYLRSRYGVTLAWYDEQHAKQNGVCAICAQPETAIIHGKVISLAVDHCHDTGKVRGLLCRACNNAIGGLKHDPALLSAAIRYLCEE